MSSNVNQQAHRIMLIPWNASTEHQTSRGYLMKEYLRRAAWWTQATGQSRWLPFLDIAAAVDPAIRAAQAVVDEVVADLARKRQGILVVEVCVNALHFAALLDAGISLPDAPDQPFEPLLLLLERGDGFFVEGGGLVDVDSLGIRIGTLEENLRSEPWVALDRAALDALDDADPPRRRR